TGDGTRNGEPQPKQIVRCPIWCGNVNRRWSIWKPRVSVIGRLVIKIDRKLTVTAVPLTFDRFGISRILRGHPSDKSNPPPHAAFILTHIVGILIPVKSWPIGVHRL